MKTNASAPATRSDAPSSQKNPPPRFCPAFTGAACSTTSVCQLRVTAIAASSKPAEPPASAWVLEPAPVQAGPIVAPFSRHHPPAAKRHLLEKSRRWVHTVRARGRDPAAPDSARGACPDRDPSSPAPVHPAPGICTSRLLPPSHANQAESPTAAPPLTPR